MFLHVGSNGLILIFVEFKLNTKTNECCTQDHMEILNLPRWPDCIICLVVLLYMDLFRITKHSNIHIIEEKKNIGLNLYIVKNITELVF